MATPFDPLKLRDDLPRYPQLLELLRVTATTVPGPSGVAQLVGSSVLAPRLFVAFVQQLRDDGSLLPRDRTPCLAADVNGVGLGLSPGQFSFFLGRLAGTWTSLPVYEIIASAPSSAGGTTTLTVQAADGSPSFSSISVLEFNESDGFTIVQPSGGVARIGQSSAASLRVEDVDGNPSLSGITTLRFDSGDGLIVSQPGAGIARIDHSSTPFTVRAVDGSPSFTNIHTIEFDENDGFIITAGSSSLGAARIDLTAPSAPAAGESALVSDVNVTYVVPTDILSITLPSAVYSPGLFMVVANFTFYSTSNTDLELHAWLWDSTSGAQVPNTERIIRADANADGIAAAYTATIFTTRATPGHVIKLQAMLEGALGDAAAVIGGTTDDSKSTLSYVRLL